MTTYTAADRYISSRTNLPTSLSSVEISAEFSAKVRAQSFFSARVAEASMLERLRDISDSYSRGETNLAQARTDAKLMLAKSGFGYVPSGKSGMPDLGSTARLDLILRQNSGMAHAVGQREVSLDPDIVERFPYFRYIARDGARSSHSVLDNLVLPKTDPFWHTHTPPWDFNCRCGIEDCDAEEAAQYGVDKAVDRGDGSYALSVNGTPVNLMPNASGYEFDVNEALGSCDLSRIKSPDARRVVHSELVTMAEKMDDGLTLRGAGAARLGELTVEAPDNIPEIKAAFQRVYDAVDANQELPTLSVSLGKLLQEHADALGISPDETAIVFNSQGTAHYGAKHWKLHHKNTLKPEIAINLLERTIWNHASELSEKVNKKQRKLIFKERDGAAVTTLQKYGEGWIFNIVDSWEVNDDYINQTNPRSKRK